MSSKVQSTKTPSITNASTFRMLGKKLLSSKSFNDSTTSTATTKKKKDSSSLNFLRKRNTISHHDTVIHNDIIKERNAKAKKIPTPHEDTSRSVTKARKQLVYNPYGVNTPNFSDSNNGSGSGTNYSLNSSSMMSSATSDRDASFYLHEGSERIRVLHLPVHNPNDYLPAHFQQKSTQLFDNFKFESDYKIIGTGGSAEVKRILIKKPTSSSSVTRRKKIKVYAYKKLNMIYDETDEQYYKRCSKEFIIGRHLNAKHGYGSMNIIGVYQLCKVPTTTVLVRGWGYVMELGHYDLFHVMSRVGWKNVEIREKYCIFKQIANGVKFMHDNGIVHRDLKPENVLICDDGVCKITDFGISAWGSGEVNKVEWDGPVKMCSGMIGSPPYAPPEVMVWDKKKNYPETVQKAYDPYLIDCYSLGIILMTLINGTIPFLESCDKDGRFREFSNSYEKFIEYGGINGKTFRQRGTYRNGPGSEYTFAKYFKDPGSSRVAWRLADPHAESRYSMNDLFKDPWFLNDIELCVDAMDEEQYKCPEPELDARGVDDMTSDKDRKELGRQRSMVDIGINPDKNTATEKALSAPVASPVLASDTFCTPQTSSSLSSSPKKENSGANLLYTVEEENNIDEEEKESNTRDKTDQSTLEYEKDNEKENEEEAEYVDAKADNIAIQCSKPHLESSRSSTTSITKMYNKKVPGRKRNKVVHHHLNVTHSSVTLTDSYSSNNMFGSTTGSGTGSVASSVGSTSFLRR